MFDLLIVDGTKESYIKIDNNTLKGFSFFNGEKSNLSQRELDILNMFKMSKNSKLVKQEDGIEIYFDSNSGFLHFIKNGVEDVLLFCQYNGTPCELYKKRNKFKDKNYHPEYKFIINEMKIKLFIKLASMVTILSYPIAFAAPLPEMYYDFTLVGRVDRAFHQNENLSKEDKKLFYNKKLLNDVLPYYEGTVMSANVYDNFNYLSVKFEDEREETEYSKPIGWVSTFDSSTIYLYNSESMQREEKQRSVKAHEFVHCLQTTYVKCHYNVICEASAELISSEYFDTEIDSYEHAVRNLETLIEIVGPEVIWKLNFSDQDELKEIIINNMPEVEANRLLELLNVSLLISEKEEYDNFNETKDLLYKLSSYLGKNPEENPFIRDYYKIENRYYFNSDKIKKYQPAITDFDIKVNYEIKTKVEMAAYIIYRDYESFEKAKEEGKEFLIIPNNGGTVLSDGIKTADNKVYSFKEAFENRIISVSSKEPVETFTYYSDNREIAEECNAFFDKYEVDIYAIRDKEYIWYNGSWQDDSSKEVRDYVNGSHEYVDIREELPNIYETFPEQKISTSGLFHL